MMPLVEQRRQEVVAACRRFGVRRLDLFGSGATGAFREASSDLDFVVAFVEPGSPGYADRYLGLADALERIFGRDVDLLTERSIRNPLFRHAVEATRVPVYEQDDDEAAA